MSAGSSLAFPGGRTLAAWWRQLATFHPRALWVGYLTCHRLEALVCALRPYKISPFELLVLKAFALNPAAEITLVAGLLHLAPNLVGQVLRGLQVEGLIRRDDGYREVTDAGRQALAQGDYLRARRERRAFHFWHADWSTPPVFRYVPLAHADRQPAQSALDVPCTVEPLLTAVHQSLDWKRRHGFPLDVREVLTTAPGAAVPGWEHVPIAAPLRLFAAVVRTIGDEGSVLVGVTGQTRNWELQASQPAFIVPEDDWMPVADEAMWRLAFLEWCQQRQIATTETQACTLTLQGDRLIVSGCAALEERLRGARGEAWVLAGTGLLRPAARLEAGA
jgi:DNA-binding MarR family transcriptional regulator